MSCSPLYTVWCDGENCCQWSDWSQAPTKRESRRRAKEQGWVRRGVNGRLVDLCPECATKQGSS